MLVPPLSLALAALWGWQIYLFASGQLSLHDTFIGATITLLVWITTLPRGCGIGFGSAGGSTWPTDHPIATGGIVAALTALALAARGIYFDAFPPANGQLWEEAQMGHIAAASIAQGSLDYFFPIPDLIAESGFRLFGVSMQALRLPFVAVGTAALPVFFVAARMMGLSMGATSLIGALFATSAYLSATSRVALETFSPILTLCIALAVSFYAARSTSLFSVALAGLGNGLLATEYTSFKLYPPLLLAMITLALWRDPALAPRRGMAVATRVALFLLCAGAVVLPIALVPYDNPLRIFGEGILRHHNDMARTGIGWPEWWHRAAQRVAESASYAFVRGSSNGLLPTTNGVLDFYTGSIGVAALAYCAVRARRSASALFLAVAIVSTIVLAGLLTQNPARYRLAPLVPLALLAIGMALDALRARWPGRLVPTLAAFVVVALCAVNLHLLFGVAMSDPLVLAEFGDRRIAVAHQIAALQRDYDATVLLATRERYMGGANDFSFLYDLDRVEIVDLDRAPPLDRGMLLADIEDADRVRALATTGDCVEKHYRYGAHSVGFLVCRNTPSNPPASPSRLQYSAPSTNTLSADTSRPAIVPVEETGAP